jgi:hypothetical protein
LRAAFQCSAWCAITALADIAERAGIADFGDWGGLCQQKGERKHEVVGE